MRLLGVRVSHLKKVRSRGEDHSLQSVAENDQNQLELLTDPVAEEVVRLTGALDSLRDKYGEQVIKLAGTMIR